MLEIDLQHTYIAMIENSIGSNMFRNLYVVESGASRDILDDGDLSCSFFVSTIVFHFGFIKSPRATVLGLIKDLESSGWTKTDKPKEGDILVWEPASQVGGEFHRHVGFYIDGNTAISNSFSLKRIVEHHPTFENIRKIEVVYTYSKCM